MPNLADALFCSDLNDEVYIHTVEPKFFATWKAEFGQTISKEKIENAELDLTTRRSKSSVYVEWLFIWKPEHRRS